MKKSLIALAALATVATAAQAQSSVTVYGIIDSGIASANGMSAGRTTTVSGGTLATSRLGFKGTEDLGGGLKANFNLESGLNTDTGELQTTTILFDRQSWVGLEQANVGQVQVGRTTRLDFDTAVAGDTFGAANFGGNVGVTWGNVNSVSASGGPVASSRVNNSVKLTSAKFAGLSAAYQRGLGEQAGDVDKHSFYAYQLDYTQGAGRLTYASSRTNDASGNKLYATDIVTASYDFKVAKLFAGFAEREQPGAAADVKVTYVGATAPITSKISVMTQYTKVDNKAGVAADDAKAFAAGGLYAFSPRTTGYLLAGRVNNNGSAAQGLAASTVVAAPAGGADQTAYAVGIRHTF